MKYLFNDYATREGDEGIEFLWTVGYDEERNPVHVPIRVRRSLGIRDRRKAIEAATKMHFKPDGTPVIDGFDEALYNLIIAEAVIVSWPFEESDGTPTPINRKNLEALESFALDELAMRYAKVQKAQEDALGPFEKQSEDPS